MTNQARQPLSSKEINAIITNKEAAEAFTIISYDINASRQKRRELRNWCFTNATGRWFSHSNKVFVEQKEVPSRGHLWVNNIFGITAYYGFENRQDALMFKLTWGGELAVPG